MYVYMYNIDWIRARKIRISFFPFKHSMKLSISLVTGEGELLGACPPYLVHITVRLAVVAVKLIGCDVSHKANWRLCNAERGAGLSGMGLIVTVWAVESRSG